MGTIGLVDDYIKVFKNNKDGLKGRFKVAGQLLLGLVVGSVLYFHPGVTVKEEIRQQGLEKPTSIHDVFTPEKKSTLTTIPLFKDNAFDYSSLLSWISPDLKKYTWIIFIPIVVFIIVAVSNGANLTDGIDGRWLFLCHNGIGIRNFAWVSGNLIFSDYSI